MQTNYQVSIMLSVRECSSLNKRKEKLQTYRLVILDAASKALFLMFSFPSQLPEDTAVSQERNQEEKRMAVGLLKAMYRVSWCFLFPEIFYCFLK